MRGGKNGRAIIRSGEDPQRSGSLAHDKNAHGCTKMLALYTWFTYHTSRQIRTRSMSTVGGTEGPARQLWPATLASPPSTRRKLMASLIIVYFHGDVCTFFCV
jgi:hypothetical protein